MLKVDKLTIERERWGDNKGKLKGEVKFVDTEGSVEILIDEECSERVVALCAEAITRQAAKVTQTLIDSLPKTIANEEPPALLPSENQSPEEEEATLSLSCEE